MIRTWKRQAAEGMAGIFTVKGSNQSGSNEAEIKDLHAKIGQLIVERVCEAGA